MNDSSSELGFPWSELDLAATRDISEIQRAYARRLKTIDLARERDAFLALRRAYEAALVAAFGCREGRHASESSGPTNAVVPPPRITAAQAETIAADLLRQKKIKLASYGKPQIEFDLARRQWKLFYTPRFFGAPGEHFTINVDENGGAGFVGGL